MTLAVVACAESEAVLGCCGTMNAGVFELERHEATKESSPSADAFTYAGNPEAVKAPGVLICAEKLAPAVSVLNALSFVASQVATSWVWCAWR